MESKYNTKNTAKKIKENFDVFFNKYNHEKYPAEIYATAKRSFSNLSATPAEIKNILEWKWGQANKENYPKAHKNLIQEIQELWPQFVKSKEKDNPKSTFDWWSKNLKKHTRYITVAFITHLIHHKNGTPIIDQHNYRAMNHLKQTTGKLKPSTWADVIELQNFITEMNEHMPDLSRENLDKYLMMLGRDLKRQK